MRRKPALIGAWIARLAAALLYGLCAAPSAQAQEALLAEIGCGSEIGSLERLPATALDDGALDDGALDVLAIGSSSTAGVGAGAPEFAYPAQLAWRLLARREMREADVEIRVTARGVSGERAAGALARLEQEISATMPDLLIWQVGVNDAIAGVPLAQLRREVLAGLAIARKARLPVILVDPQYFPKIGGDRLYAETVEVIAEIAHRQGAALVRRFDRMRRAEALGEEAMQALLASDRFHMSRAGHSCLSLDLAETVARMIDLSAD